MELKVIYRIGIKGTGGNTIDDVEVTLEGISGRDKASMRQRLNMPQAILEPMFRYSESQKTTIHPSVEPKQFVNFIEWYPDKREIKVCYDKNLYSYHQVIDKFKPIGKFYCVSLTIEGRNILASTFQFWLEISDSELSILDKEEYEHKCIL